MMGAAMVMKAYYQRKGGGFSPRNGRADFDTDGFGYGRATDECREATYPDDYLGWGRDYKEIDHICGVKETPVSSFYLVFTYPDEVIGFYGRMADGNGSDTSCCTGIRNGSWRTRGGYND